MPQFDKLNFISQLFWTFLFFFSFYFIFVKNYLPLFSKVLKSRIKILKIENNNNFSKYDKITPILSDSLLKNKLLLIKK